MTPEQLFEKNQRLAYWIISRRFPIYIGDEDMQQIALIGLWRACRAFNPAKGCKFTTLAVTYITRQIGRELTLRQYKKRLLEVQSLSLSQPIDNDADYVMADVMLAGVGWEDDVIAAVDFYNALAVLTPKQREIICGIAAGATQTDIAKREGIGPQAIYERCRLARKKLAAMMG